MKKDCAIHFLNNNPSVVILIGILSSILPVVISPTCTYYCAVFVLLAVGVVIGLIADWRIGTKTIIWGIFGITVIFLSEGQLLKKYSILLPVKRCGVQVEAVVTDPEIISDETIGLPAPKCVKMKVRNVRYSSRKGWLKSAGLTSVLLPHGSKIPSYGELLKLEGRFVPPQRAPFPGGFDYARYLKSQGIDKVLICTKCESIGSAGFPFNVYRRIYLLRDSMLGYLCHGIKTDETKAFLAGFFFGCRQGINHQMKQAFLRSGTVHILAISGLHVGILALILLVSLRFVPTAPRYLIVPLVLFCYIFLTGFRPSGVRALAMISVFCFHKAFFYSVRPINSIAFAAILILLLNPFAVTDVGFQFSFIIAGFLVLAWAKTKYILKIMAERRNWVIFTNFTFPKKLWHIFREKTLLLTISSTIAGLTGAGLVLYYQGLIIPLVIILNILILPLLLPLFLVGFVKILVFSVFGDFVSWLNFLLDGIVSVIIHLANWGGYSAFAKYYQQPSIFVLIIFYVSLVGLFITHRKKKILAFSWLIGGIFVFWLTSGIFGAGMVAVIQGAEMFLQRLL